MKRCALHWVLLLAGVFRSAGILRGQLYDSPVFSEEGKWQTTESQVGRCIIF
jgi:hypothetical protein